MEQKANALNTMGNGKENKWQAVLPSLSLSFFCVVAEPNLATCLRILSGTWWWRWWQQRGHMCGIMRMLRQGKSCMQCCLVPLCLLPPADSKSIHMPMRCRCHMSSYTHTHPLLLPPSHPPYRGQKFIIKTLPSLLCAVNCKYDSRVRLGTLCRIARNGLCCPALGHSII